MIGTFTDTAALESLVTRGGSPEANKLAEKVMNAPTHTDLNMAQAAAQFIGDKSSFVSSALTGGGKPREAGGPALV